jgi:Co/Zn/Cd efflux system component
MTSPTTEKGHDRPGAALVSNRSLRPGRSVESRRTAAVALASNVTIAAAKIVAGVVSGSAAMYAEAAHSLADSVNQTFLLRSIGLSERPPDPEHPFGSGRERFLWTFDPSPMPDLVTEMPGTSLFPPSSSCTAIALQWLWSP